MKDSAIKIGAWIFASHSHRGFEEVRAIHDELERRGHNPVLCFLKCMEATEAGGSSWTCKGSKW